MRIRFDFAVDRPLPDLIMDLRARALGRDIPFGMTWEGQIEATGVDLICYLPFHHAGTGCHMVGSFTVREGRTRIEGAVSASKVNYAIAGGFAVGAAIQLAAGQEGIAKLLVGIAVLALVDAKVAMKTAVRALGKMVG